MYLIPLANCKVISNRALIHALVSFTESNLPEPVMRAIITHSRRHSCVGQSRPRKDRCDDIALIPVTL